MCSHKRTFQSELFLYSGEFKKQYENVWASNSFSVIRHKEVWMQTSSIYYPFNFLQVIKAHIHSGTGRFFVCIHLKICNVLSVFAHSLCYNKQTTLWVILSFEATSKTCAFVLCTTERRSGIMLGSQGFRSKKDSIIIVPS